LAAIAFVGIHAFDVPFPIIILGAAAIGFIGGRAGVGAFLVAGGHGPKSATGVPDAETVLGEDTPNHARPDLRWALGIGATLFVLWIAPVLILGLTLGWTNIFSQIAVFFSKMAVVTFGGAYAVLAYVAQEAVETYGWLRPGEMLDGLGMAETTPGPLIMITQFVGFMGAYRNAGGLDPLAAGVLGGILTTWVTFTPCFLWIFLGAPFVEALRGAKALNAALAAITAAVVGVILNLAVWFGLHVLFRQVVEVEAGWLRLSVPTLSSANWSSVLIVAMAAIAAFRFKVGVFPLLLACAALGVAIHMTGFMAPPA